MSDQIKQRKPGDKVEDGSYYMGISLTTGTNFYLFLENATDTTKDVADKMSFNEATELLQESHVNGKTLHGHIYSKHQTEESIIDSYNNGTADGGLRRLTKEEWQQAYDVLETICLRTVAKEICIKPNSDCSVQTATTAYRSWTTWARNLKGYGFSGFVDIPKNEWGKNALLVGRSDLSPKA